MPQNPNSTQNHRGGRWTASAVSYTTPRDTIVGHSVLDVATDIATVLGEHDVARVHKLSRATDVPVNVLDIGLIGRELRWRPAIPWMEALARTAAWMRSATFPGAPSTF